MILVILVIGLTALIVGIVLHESSWDNECVGLATGIVGGAITFIAAVALLCLCAGYAENYGIDQKIELYETENKQIEEDISILVSEYMKYEDNIFTECSPDSAMTLIALYPELKSNLLVEKQIEVYVSNTEEIKRLKSQQISAPLVKWWLYFGG